MPLPRPLMRSCSLVATARLPPESLERDTPPVEYDTFFFEALPLDQSTARAPALQTQSTLRIDHSVPWHRRAGGQRGEGVAHLTRMSRQPGSGGDLPVRRHF